MSHKRLLSACFSFLVPVARFLLRHGISFNEFEELARTAFVQVAGSEFGIRGRPTNTSRISALTGIPRKEVSRIRESIRTIDPTPRTDISPLGDVLHHWYTDPEFLDAEGSPKALAAEGELASFEELARKCAGDLPIGALKSELLRTGAIRRTHEGMLLPNRRQAVPIDYSDKLITSLSFNMFGLASTIAFNSNPERTEESRPERFIQSENLSHVMKLELRGILRHRIESFAVDLDNYFSTLEHGRPSASGRVGVGIYYYEENK